MEIFCRLHEAKTSFLRILKALETAIFHGNWAGKEQSLHTPEISSKTPASKQINPLADPIFSRSVFNFDSFLV
jgi:hypothetical protein